MRLPHCCKEPAYVGPGQYVVVVTGARRLLDTHMLAPGSPVRGSNALGGGVVEEEIKAEMEWRWRGGGGGGNVARRRDATPI